MPVARLPLDMIKIEDDGVHLSTVILINNKEARMLIDTGASRTVMDSRRIMKYVDEKQVFLEMEQLSSGLGTSTMKSQATVLSRVDLGGITMEEYQAVIIDMTHVNSSYELLGLPPIDGVIGGDLLLRFRASVHYGKAELVLRP